MAIIVVHSKPEESTSQSGVIPISLLKEESSIDITIAYLAFIVRNLF